MIDSHQKGSDEEWLKHSNTELSQFIKQRDRRISFLKFVVFVLFLALAWTVFKFAQNSPLEDLLRL